MEHYWAQLISFSSLILFCSSASTWSCSSGSTSSLELVLPAYSSSNSDQNLFRLILANRPGSLLFIVNDFFTKNWDFSVAWHILSVLCGVRRWTEACWYGSQWSVLGTEHQGLTLAGAGPRHGAGTLSRPSLPLPPKVCQGSDRFGCMAQASK